MSNKREQRDRLWREANGLCHWCRTMTVLPAHGVIMPNTATLDHLDDRFSGRRATHHDGVRRKVLACSRCNRERAQEAVSVYGHALPPRRLSEAT